MNIFLNFLSIKDFVHQILHCYFCVQIVNNIQNYLEKDLVFSLA